MLAPVLEERWEGRAQSSKHVVRNLRADEVSSEPARPPMAAGAGVWSSALPATERPATTSHGSGALAKLREPAPDEPGGQRPPSAGQRRSRTSCRPACCP